MKLPPALASPPAAGWWVFVCGPSGVGKDSVIAAAREALGEDARVLFARRVSTRIQAHAHSDPVADETVDPAQFERISAAHGFAWQWEAHGHRYGIRAHHAADVDAGRVVVVNGSRAHVAAMRRDPRVKVVLVTAPADVIERRLRERGRDTPAAIVERLARNARLADLPADLRIDNTGSLADAAARLAAMLGSLARAVARAPQ